MIKGLGYLRYQATDLDRWKAFNENIIGGESIASDDGRWLKIRLDEFSHRLCLVKGDSDEPLAYGWQVESFDDLIRVKEGFERVGVVVNQGTAEQASERDVDHFFAYTDPMGHRHEVFYAPHVGHLPPRFSRPIKGFNTGDLGLGHVNIVCKDVEKAQTFYEKAMGFRVSDYIRWDGADATFYHCNPRHHSFGFMNECFGQTAPSLHHLMLEMLDQDDVGRLYDEICDKYPEYLILHLGKHSNDHMISMYIKTPSSFAIELGWGGRLVNDEEWQITTYSSPKLWGHRRA